MPSTNKRIVTGHDGSGRAIVLNEDEISSTLLDNGRAAFSLLWSTNKSPADNTDDFDGGQREVGLSIENGTVLRIVDFAPRRSGPMHRTSSIDYGIVLEGEIVLELDDGVTRVLNKGDVCVQRGTMHAWHNRTDDWVKVAFVLIDAKPVEVAGKVLNAEVPYVVGSKPR